LADVSKTKPATFTLWKTAQTGLTSTTSHWDSLRTLRLVKQLYSFRHAANQLEWPSLNRHRSTNWTTPSTLSLCCIFSFHRYQQWELTANNTVWFMRKGHCFGRNRTGHCEKRSLCERGSNSEWLPRLSYFKLQT
jgi:hypothetical protein